MMVKMKHWLNLLYRFRLTLVKSWNMEEADSYVELIEKGQPGEGTLFISSPSPSPLSLPHFLCLSSLPSPSLRFLFSLPSPPHDFSLSSLSSSPLSLPHLFPSPLTLHFSFLSSLIFIPSPSPNSSDFIEIKSVTYCGKSDASSLTMENVPWHHECCQFSEAIANRWKGVM